MSDSPLEIPIEISDSTIDKSLDEIAGSMAEVDALAEKIETSFKLQEQELQRIKILSSPDNIKRQVELEKEMEKVRKKQMEALEKARGGGGFGKGLAEAFHPGNLAGAAGAIIGGQSGAGFIGQVGGMLGMALAGPAGAAIGGAIGPALEKAAPGAMGALSVVFDDISATFGQVLIPVIEQVIPLVRLAGDVVATILPDAQQMGEIMEMLNPTLQDMAGAYKEIMSVVGPLINDVLIVGLKVLAGAIWVCVLPLRFFAAIVGEIFHGLRGENSKLRSSAGNAAKQAQFTSFGSYQQNLITGGLSSGKATGITSIAHDVSGIAASARMIVQLLRNPLKFVLFGDEQARKRNERTKQWLDKRKAEHGGKIVGLTDEELEARDKFINEEA